MTKLLLTCLPFLLFAACDSTPPEQILIGEWAIDPDHLQKTVVEAEKHGRVAKSMAERNAKFMAGVRATFSADGKAVMRGGNLDGEGTYVVEKVLGNVVTVAMAIKGRPPSKLIFTIIDNQRMVMSDAHQVWSMQLIRG